MKRFEKKVLKYHQNFLKKNYLKGIKFVEFIEFWLISQNLVP